MGILGSGCGINDDANEASAGAEWTGQWLEWGKVGSALLQGILQRILSYRMPP